MLGGTSSSSSSVIPSRLLESDQLLPENASWNSKATPRAWHICWLLPPPTFKLGQSSAPKRLNLGDFSLKSREVVLKSTEFALKSGVFALKSGVFTLKSRYFALKSGDFALKPRPAETVVLDVRGRCSTSGLRKCKTFQTKASPRHPRDPPWKLLEFWVVRRLTRAG